MSPHRTCCVVLLAALAAAAGCRSPMAEIEQGLAHSLAQQPEEHLLGTDHKGPPVVDGDSGTARFVRTVDGAFDVERAMQMVTFIDGFYRAPANDGYEAVLDRLAAELRAAGYGNDPRLELVEYTTPIKGEQSAWTPLGGKLVLHTKGEAIELHAFDTPGDDDRVMLPINTPSGSAKGGIALSLEDLDKGEILVIEAPPSSSTLHRAHSLGATGVVSSSLQAFNHDPSGRERHLDAIQFLSVPAGLELPVVQVSPRSRDRIVAVLESDPAAQLELETRVKLDQRPLRTLVATIVGADRPEEAVVLVSHVQEPGAGDNATGVAGLLESARLSAALLVGKKLEWPSRSIAFIWGDEFRQSQAWLEQSKRKPVAGISSDMTGQSREKTGAIALLERMPDPGAVKPLAPDEHTPWGAKPVDEASLKPNGLAVIARCAMADVGELAGGWVTAEHPWEGGSDHDEFIARNVPAALFWHFTDFAYHTSLDRLGHVDPAELRRTGVALLSTAFALADPQPADLDRYVRTLQKERLMRMAAAEAAGDAKLAEQWRAWCEGAREWLRVECLRIPPDKR